MNEVKSPAWHLAVPPVVLVGLAVLFYSFSLNYEFQFDDLANIVNNFQVRVGGMHELFFSSTRWVSQLLNTFYYQMGKFRPYVYRLANVTCHITTGLAVYFISYLMLRRLNKKSFYYLHRGLIAFFTGGLFLLHRYKRRLFHTLSRASLKALPRW